MRYADDFLILVRSQRAAERVMAGISRFIERNLKLKVNDNKSQVAKTDQTNFLGFTFKAGKIRWSDKAFAEFKRRAKILTGRSWFVSMAYRLKKLAQYLRGWINYFGVSEYYLTLPEIDQWCAKARAHVLLETVALCAHQGAKSSQTRHPSRCGHPHVPIT